MLDFTQIEHVRWTEPRLAYHAKSMREHRKTEHYKRSPHPRGIRTTLLELPICAIDGEGKTRADGSHDYTLLAASWPQGHAKIESNALTTQECFDFLMRLPEHHTYVIYGGNYDANMMLKMLPQSVINRLLDKGYAYWKNFSIRWIERKFFRIRSQGRSVTVYDVLANWQVGFVKACRSWDVGTQSELDIVQRMKEQRGNFDDVDDATISDYCYLECDLLRTLCRKLFDAILATPYRPNAVYGPGALASAAMKKHGIKRYMAELPSSVEQLSHYAYFGGRFDCAMLGWFSDVWQYDIKSAYPDQIRFLPCLQHAEWIHETAPTEIAEYGLYQVEWDIHPDAPWPPFPHRDTHGNIFYPSRGRGWYHGNEVTAARDYINSRKLGTITISTGWRLKSNCNHVPFDFVDELFEIRKSMPYAQGVVFKLILNSLYGKLAQQVGSENDRKPPFQCFYWAGAITAGTRAKILRAITADPSAVIGVATDSVVALRERSLQVGSNLGEWEVKRLSEYAQVSNGIYRGLEQTGNIIERSRGFARSTLDWNVVKTDFEASRGTGVHRYEGKSRFITLREARNRADRATIACTWTQGKDRARELNFFPLRRFPGAYSRDGPTMELLSLEPTDLYESQPFKLKTKSQDVIDARIKFNAYAWQDY